MALFSALVMVIMTPPSATLSVKPKIILLPNTKKRVLWLKLGPLEPPCRMSLPLNTHIQSVLSNLESHLSGLLKLQGIPAAAGPDGARVVHKITQRLLESGVINLHASAPNPLADVLPTLAATSKGLDAPLQQLVSNVFELADFLPWYQRPVAQNSQFMAGHCNAQIIGPQGLEVRHDLIVGITLMRPDIAYPDHQHEPEEIYLVLGNGRWRQGKGEWHTPDLGGLVYNPSNVMHGMKSLDQPLIALWCLPLDKPFTSFNQSQPTP